MIKKRTNFLMGALFALMVSTNLAGCDISAEAIKIIEQIIDGNSDGCIAGCVGCAQDCGCLDGCACNCACDACDCGCADCGSCTIQKIPGGFNAAHPNARIKNAAQVRVTDPTLDFVADQIPVLVGALGDVAPLPYFPINLVHPANANDPDPPEAVVRVLLQNPDIFTPLTTDCDGNFANGWGPDHPCVRARLDVNFRTCAYVPDNPNTPADEQAAACATPDPITITTSGITCDVTLNSEAGASPTLPVEADIALMNQTAPTPYIGYSRAAIIDADITNNAAFEAADVTVSCTGISPGLIAFAACGPTWYIPSAGVCKWCLGATTPLFSSNPTGCAGFANDCDNPCTLQGIVNKTITSLATEDADNDANDLDDIIDYVLAGPGDVCQPATAANQCPAGTTFCPDAKNCVINGTGPCDDPTKFSDVHGRCTGPLLGLEGRMDLGSILAAISPGAKSVVDFLFMAGGDGVRAGAGAPNTAGTGYNVNFLGGLENLQHDNCVPLLSAGDPGFLASPGDSIPQVGIFQNSVRPGTGNPFGVGAAISEEFANYALFKVWDSGMLCLTVSSALSAELSPSMFGPLLFSGTIDRFLFPLSTSQSYLALSIRPQQPPIAMTEEVDDPNEPGDKRMDVTVALPQLQLDFIFWTNERYTRIATLQTDLSITLNLDIEPSPTGDELKLGLGAIAFENTTVLNASTLLSEGELSADFGAVLNAAAPLIAGGLAGAIPNIGLEALLNNTLAGGIAGLQLPLRIDFGPDSIVPFEDAGHPFVGVFFNLVSPPPGGGLTQLPETSVAVTSVTMPEDRTAFAAATLGQGPLPRVEIAIDATGPGAVEYEYSYRTTFTGWSEWSRSRYAVIEDPSLVLQQRQQVFARARIKDSANGIDISSAKADFVIDVTAPSLQVTIAPNGAGELQAFDMVYGSDLQYRIDGGDWKAIHSGRVSIGQVSDETVVEVRDGSGNVGSNKLRGRTDPDAAVGGCGCATAGTQGGSSSVPGIALSLLALGMVVSRRRRR